jgi:hypothetical protein
MNNINETTISTAGTAQLKKLLAKFRIPDSLSVTRNALCVMNLLVAVYTNKSRKSAEMISVVFVCADGFMSKRCCSQSSFTCKY